MQQEAISNEPVTPEESLPNRLREQVGAERLWACYQCAKCTSGCPLSKMDGGYNPRLFLRAAALGLKEQVLGAETLWYCLLCYTCQEKCPEDARPAEIITALKNEAFRQGKAPDALILGAKILMKESRIYLVDDFLNEEREDEGLPALDEEEDVLEEVFAITGLKDRLEKGVE